MAREGFFSFLKKDVEVETKNQSENVVSGKAILAHGMEVVSHKTQDTMLRWGRERDAHVWGK